jgi:hypothetical protein
VWIGDFPQSSRVRLDGILSDRRKNAHGIEEDMA